MMWSVGISVSPCEDAERLGYDDRQMNRIVIRMARYFLDRDMRVIFGHDWREDGVMRAVADFAAIVAARIERDGRGIDPEPRMINLVPGTRGLSRAAADAERDGGGVLEVIALDASDRVRGDVEVGRGDPARGLTALRHELTKLLDPGCRVCLGGRTKGFQGKEPGVMEEARLAVEYRKPLYLMGGFGGATREFGDHGNRYLETENGLCADEKEELFNTMDIERAVRLIAQGIDRFRSRSLKTIKRTLAEKADGNAPDRSDRRLFAREIDARPGFDP